MDQRQFVDLARRRYLAQTLEEFELTVETLTKRIADEDLSPAARALLAQDLAEAIVTFKRTVRRKFGAFAKDCDTAMTLSPNIAINADAIELKEALHDERGEGLL
jgi:hypothetical protein